MNAIAAIITVIVAIILFTSIAYVKAPAEQGCNHYGIIKRAKDITWKGRI